MINLKLHFTKKKYNGFDVSTVKYSRYVVFQLELNLEEKYKNIILIYLIFDP